MERYENWFVCLDLSNMDDILVGYANFLTTEIKPKKITFVHVIKSQEVAKEMIELFPEIKNEGDVEAAIRKELKEKIDSFFANKKVETELLIKNGRPTDIIIETVESLEPDLTIMGKKSGYIGRGVIPRRIMKYLPSSILFVPETSRYQLKKAVVPIDFSDQSAKAITVASELADDKGGTVTALHIYNYPARFFPYIVPEEEDEEKMNKYLKGKKEDFIEKHSIPDDIEFVFSLHIDGSKMDQLYDQIVHDQADLIVAASKADNKITSILREDFTDQMAYYRFGVPMLIIKDKEKHQKFLKSLFGK